MKNYLITDIKWHTNNYNDNEDDEGELNDDLDLPEQLIIQTSSHWDEELREMVYEHIFEEYGWEPRSFSHEELDDEDLLEELDVIEI
jgi:hypothetical protein